MHRKIETKHMEADALANAVADKVAALQADLLAKVDANLSGAVLQERSGTLKASILADLRWDGAACSATLVSMGVPYAAIQEDGGTTPPHDIVPVKAKVLAFAGCFARSVKHPGSVIPAHHYLGGALDALRGDIVTDLKSAVCAALGAA